MGKLLRFLAVLLAALTAVFNLMGGIGTSCVAFGAEKYESMAGIVPYKWLYLIFVVLTIAFSVFQIAGTVKLIRRKDGAYRMMLIVLVVGLVITGIHMMTSQALRGKSAPNNMRFYLNLIALVYFLLLRLPGAWDKVGYGVSGSRESDGTGAAAALMSAGLVVLNIQYIAGGTHTWDEINFADVWHVQLAWLGWGLMLVGAVVSAIQVLRGVRWFPRTRLKAAQHREMD